MDRATVPEFEFSEEDRSQERLSFSRKKWKKRRGFVSKNRKASRPTTYMGQRSNTHPRSRQ